MMVAVPRSKRNAGWPMSDLRARRRVWICHASSRRVYNQWLACAPSRFIDELPEDLVEHQMEAGLHGGVAESGLEVLEENCGNGGAGRGPGFGACATIREALRGAVRGEVSTVNSIAIGVRIFHQKFGYGTVVSNDGGKLEIDFEKAGTKKVLESFVEPA